MFDFENLEVYKKAKAFNAIVGKMVLTNLSLDRHNQKSIEAGFVKHCFEYS